MNLQTHISPDLWHSVSGPYQAGNYSHAVLEALHHLTSVLRERSGVDGDGVALVGQALGGDNPKLRVNALQSESERNVQKGMEHLLRGIYLAIRNPRSHQQHRDTQKEADALIHFVDYLLTIMTASKEAFTVDGFVATLTDPEFVESKRYAELLVATIPSSRRGDALVALYATRKIVEVRKLRFVVSVLLSLLDDAQLAHYVSAVSNELKVVSDDLSIRTSMQMLTPEIWPRVDEVARLRIEHRMLREIASGEVRVGGKVVGSLGTWSRSFVRVFSVRAEAVESLLTKLEDVDGDDRHYVAKFFMTQFPEIAVDEAEIRRAVRAIASAVEANDANVREATIAAIRRFPAPWQGQLAEALKHLADAENPAVVLDDGTPFLGELSAGELSDDDIPF